MTAPPPPSSSTSNVRVGVRIRPLSPLELASSGRAVVDGSSLSKTVSLGSAQRTYAYDAVYRPDCAQSELYADCSPPLLDAFLSGYNATILAYGQTGSGKTHTMGSGGHGRGTDAEEGGMGAGGAGADSNCDGTVDESDGLIPRFVSEVFSSLRRRKEASERSALRSPTNADGCPPAAAAAGEGEGGLGCGDGLTDYSLTASFLEVYGEEIHDLLDVDDGRESLPIREDANGDVVVKGLREVRISSGSEAMAVLASGSGNRITAATLMNRTSSRSHAVFVVSLRQTARGADGTETSTASRFTFVDLAGSERLKKTGAQGERAREGIKINEGLLALGNVINALADEERLSKGEKVHVPYRQSKLTRLLQEALGGNSRTLFLACVSPSDANVGETLSTLRYAHRARNIRNTPTRNVDGAAAELRRWRALAGVLRVELARQKFGGAAPEGEGKEDEDVGVVDEELLKREDVVAYMRRIEEKADELSGSGASVPTAFVTKLSAASTGATHSFADSDFHGRRPAELRRSAMPATSTPSDCHGGKSPRATVASVAEPVRRDEAEDPLPDIDPEEDLHIINQLLELRRDDQKFQRQQEDDRDRLDAVEGEIASQEEQLLRLREHLGAYRDLRDRHERLMCEVANLESEKRALADELEQTQANPARGCSKAIRTKLQRVEESLARARSEARKHRQTYRKAEEEARKCRAMEGKIQDLKRAKVDLVKKQREDAARHREHANEKAREIRALERREKGKDRKLSKMETECQKYKSNLERSRSHCDKLSDKLKQTETHLMRLLTKRRNDLNRDPAKVARRSRGPGVGDARHPAEGREDQFAPANEETKSIEFMLKKTVLDRVTLYQAKEVYESKVIECGELMQGMAREVKSLREWKRDYHTADPDCADEILAQIREHEDSIQELQLQIELLENDLEQLRAKCPSIEERVFEEDAAATDGPALQMIAKLDGPLLRTLLWNLMESYATAELQRRTLKDALSRKDSALQSFESELSLQNERNEALARKLDKRRKTATSDGQDSDPVDVIEGLEEEIKSTNQKLDACLKEKAALTSKVEEIHAALFEYQDGRAQSEERLALYNSQQKLTESTEGTEHMLKQLQEILALIGISVEERETVRSRLENCVEDACSSILNEYTDLRDEKNGQVATRREQLAQMHAALGLEEVPSDRESSCTSPHSLNAQLESLDRQLDTIKPHYDAALERRKRLVCDADALTLDLYPLGNLSDNLQKLMQRGSHTKRKRPSQIPPRHRASMETSRQARAKVFNEVKHMMKGLQTIDEDFGQENGWEALDQQKSSKLVTVAETNSLATSFLDDCEIEIKELRLIKADQLLHNLEKCDYVRGVIQRMHMGTTELSSIVIHSLKKKRNIPNWWDEGTARMVYDALSKKGSILVNGAFTDHLMEISDILQHISDGRQLLSDTLKSVIEECHKALLATAEGCGMDVNELARELELALVQLPPQSKQYVKACIEEMQMLVKAAESVSQAEIETLSVLWESLCYTSTQFWSELDSLTKELEMTTRSPFDHVMETCPSEVEEWVLKMSNDAARVQRILGVRVFKLEKIHEEVARLKRKQDAKNRIMGLNDELRLLNLRLVDFEKKAGDKQRLMDKKNSSSLLEEERFRKQMQGMFTTKLGTLRQMLNEWEASEGQIEDDDMLSEVVKSMLQNSHRIDAWMNEKTRLMHLKTTTSKSSHHATPRTAGANRGRRQPSTSVRKRTSPIPSLQPNIHQRPKSKLSNHSTSSSKRSSSISTANSRQSYSSAREARPKTVGQQSSPSSPTLPPKVNAISTEQPSRKALSSSMHNAQPPEQKLTKQSLSVEVNEHGSPVLLPFGNLLAPTPKEKENSSYL